MFYTLSLIKVSKATTQGGGTVTGSSAISIKSAHAWEEKGSTLHEEIWALPPPLLRALHSEKLSGGRRRQLSSAIIECNCQLPQTGKKLAFAKFDGRRGDAEKAKKERGANLKFPPFIKRCRCVATCLRNTFRFPTASYADSSIRPSLVRPLRVPASWNRSESRTSTAGGKVFVIARD